MQIVLTAVDQPLAKAWQRFCGDLEFVSVHLGSIFDVNCDAVVSPANSFGFMDGGIDLIYSRQFGWHVQDRVQEAIKAHHHGELLVGSAELVETDNPAIPYLIAAPTMRVPTLLRDSVNPYLAARAVLNLIKHAEFRAGAHRGEPVCSVVNTVAFPGLGTGVGRVPPDICAKQMRAAIDEVVLEKHGFPVSWHDAQRRHQLLYRARATDLQLED